MRSPRKVPGALTRKKNPTDPIASEEILLTHFFYDAEIAENSGPRSEKDRDDLGATRTKGETPLHRAAAFGDEEAIQLLLDAGASLEAKDMNGDTPLSWASWYGRPVPILRKLLYGNFRINPNNRSMQANLLGKPR